MRHHRAHFDLKAAERTAAQQSAWSMVPPDGQLMLSDAFWTGAYCVFHALTDANLDAVARLSIISQLSEQFDAHIRERANPIITEAK